MSNKEQRRDFSDVEYRFSFSLTISDTDTNNDTIIVKRDFNVYNLDEESLCSIELKECIDEFMWGLDGTDTAPASREVRKKGSCKTNQAAAWSSS